MKKVYIFDHDELRKLTDDINKTIDFLDTIAILQKGKISDQADELIVLLRKHTRYINEGYIGG